jgi:DHA1 family tetracycline resistance protein-like MFS transporter
MSGFAALASVAKTLSQSSVAGPAAFGSPRQLSYRIQTRVTLEVVPGLGAGGGPQRRYSVHALVDASARSAARRFGTLARMMVTAQQPRKAALYFIFVTVLIDMLAFGMIIPVLPILVQDFVGGSAARGAEIFGLFGTAWALMQFIFSPVQGSLSDHFGRRPVILISCTGLGLDFILTALAPNLWWLLAGRVISGVAAASIATAGAYISDITPPERRAASFGIIGAAFGVGFVVGPALGGLLGAISPRLPFWASAFMALANVCWGLFALPESLPKDKRVAFAWKNANPLGALKLLRSHPILAGLAGSFFLINLAQAVLPSTTVLYMHYRYGWGTRAVGLMLAGVGICSLIVQGFLVKPAVRLLHERRALALGLAFGAAGFAIYGLAPTGAIFWIGVPVMALWGIATPSLQAIMTRSVSVTEQGRLQGALACLMGLSSLIGPTLFTQIFALAIGTHADWGLPGAPFLLSTLLILLAIVWAWRTTRMPLPEAPSSMPCPP